MQGLATGQLAASPRLEQHLDQCLACRNCEPVCPAEVPYGQLIDAGRALLNEKRPARRRVLRWLAPLAVDPVLRRSLHWLLWIYQRLGVLRLFRAVVRRGPLARLAGYLPPLRRPRDLPQQSLPAGALRGRVALFTGCVSEVAEQDVLQDAIYLLTRLGYEVQVPPTQACCGALHLHNGDARTAELLAARNLQAFIGKFDAILGSASGCTATLREYALVLPQAGPFSEQVQSLCQFLDSVWPAELQLAPLAARAAIQDPCTLRNVLRQTAAPYRLLQRIPQLEVLALAENNQCCGAAGSYFLSEAAIADQLAEKKIAALHELKPDYLVSSNVGCTLHLRAGLQRNGLTIPVLHPIQLLARQSRAAEST